MRKILTACTVGLLIASAQAAENYPNVVIPTQGSIAPILTQPQDYVPAPNQDYTSFSMQLLASLGTKVQYPLQIIYKPTHKKEAVNLRHFLVNNGAKYRNIHLVPNRTAIYPLYVRAIVHMPKQANCLSYKEMDEQLADTNKLQSARPCYSINNMHLQTAF
ncbi:hypothetical protein A6A19_01835 [Actinobacillus delphinicola]|uniref:Uncharacterized protein n=1 Tax=Actinobacillus delphinicola TaxID=51161 RepID=A0A448TW96_9PAST|nr:hypothetical protein [Actinobacillus delphinicola]MDG6896768.1 hypothetical protein [Actinobacillus delphinicola]VEJ10200.1 Uncharacterised protein [Actinobacillus delphinicola]